MNTFKPTSYFVNVIINHPDVRATIERGHHRVYSDAVVQNPENAVYAYDCGVAVFIGVGQGVYEGHVAVLKPSRGSEAFLFGRNALQRLFNERRASKLVARVPLQLPAARFYCRRLGLKSESRDLFEETFSTEYDQWAA